MADAPLSFSELPNLGNPQNVLNTANVSVLLNAFVTLAGVQG